MKNLFSNILMNIKILLIKEIKFNNHNAVLIKLIIWLNIVLDNKELYIFLKYKGVKK